MFCAEQVAFYVLITTVLCFHTAGMVFGEMMSMVGVARGDIFRYGTLAILIQKFL